MTRGDHAHAEHSEPEPFGALLQRYRRAAGLTQEELAARSGLSTNAVSLLERGRRKHPYPHTVASLTQALDLTGAERASLKAAAPARESPGGSSPTPAEITEPATVRGAGLPRPPTTLVGRESEVMELGELLRAPDTRLVTLTGIGGVGKTRLALEAARWTGELFTDGVVFVELAPLVNPAFVLSAILRSLGPSGSEGLTPSESLVAHLRERRVLLVLDNFEHLLEAAPEVSELIESCPRIVVLATSRAPLRVRGEREYPVQPLGLPPSTRAFDGQLQVLNSHSGELFLERARAVSPGFRLTEENASAVAAICWRLAGLPLALELAAVKIRFLEPATLLSRLDEALSTAWSRDLPVRQRTMRTTLDWSYELLSAPEQRTFRRLAVLSGFSLETAEAVVAGGAVGSDEMLEHLGALVEQSLVRVSREEVRGCRYGMLEPVRQYAREKLRENEELEDALRRHAGFFLALAEEAEPELRGPRQVEWLDRLESESPNYRAVMAWALKSGEAEIAARIGWGLHSFWWIRGYHEEGRRWMEATLEHELPLALRARALHAAATATFAQSDYPVAEAYWREALDLSWRQGDVLVTGNAYAGMGLVGMVRADHEAAASSVGAGLALLESHGEAYLASILRTFLGTNLLAQGESERAEQTFEEVLTVARRLEVPSLSYIVLYNLAQSALARNDHEKAALMIREGIEWTEVAKDQASPAHFLEALAAVSALKGAVELSAVLLGASESLQREAGASVYNFFRPDPALRQRAEAEARSILGEMGFEKAYSSGAYMTSAQAIKYAFEA